MVSYKPVFARVLIKREVLKKSGSIIIPEAQQKRHAKTEGVIVALGETASETLKIGQKVLFGIHAGVWLDASAGIKGENDDGTLFMCADEDILAIIE